MTSISNEQFAALLGEGGPNDEPRAASASEEDFIATLKKKELFKSKGYRQYEDIIPTLLPEGEGKAEDEFMALRINTKTLLENTRKALIDKYGILNVGRFVTKGGKTKDFQFRTDEGAEWQNLGAERQLAGLRKLRQGKLLESADIESGAGFGDRLLASLPRSQKGKFRSLQKRYGPGNVVPYYGDDDEVGNFLFRETGQPGWVLHDPKGARLTDIPGDIADVGADIGQAIAGGLGSILGARIGGAQGLVLGGAALDALASATRQAGSAAIGAEEGFDPSAIGMDVAIGLAGEGVGKLAGAAARKAPVSPLFRDERFTEKVGREFVRAGKAPEELAETVAAGKRIEKQIPGLELDAPQLTMTEAGLGLRNMLERTPGAADDIAAVRRAQTGALSKNLDSTISRASGGTVDAAEAGTAVGDALSKYKLGLASARSKAARPWYDEAHRVTQGQTVMPLDNILKEIDAIVSESSGVFTTGTTSKIVDRMSKMRDQLLAQRETRTLGMISGARPEGTSALGAPRATVKQFQRDMGNLGKIAYGKHRLVDDIPLSEDRLMAKRLLDAMRNDLDDALKMEGLSGEAATALKSARQAWHEGSVALEQADTKVTQQLMKMFGEESQEGFAKKLSSGFTNQQVAKAMQIFSKASPKASNDIRAAALEEIFSRASGVDKFSPQVFANIMDKKSTVRRLMALFAGDTGGRKVIGQLRTIADASKRVIAQGATKGKSPTTPLLWMEQSIRKTGVPLLPGAINLMRRVGHAMADDAVFARTLADPAKRDLFLSLVKPPKWAKSRAITKSATQLLGLLVRDGLISEEDIEQ